MTTQTWYRLVYKDGGHGAWTTNTAWIDECLKTFRGAVVETKELKKFELLGGVK